MTESESPRPLPDDPGDIVARGFGEALDPTVGLGLALRYWPLSVGALLATLLAVTLPAPAEQALWGLLWGAALTLMIPWGLRVRDEAWLRPDAELASSEWLKPDFAALAPAAFALGLLVLPTLLGFWGGIAWALVLIAPGSVVAMVLLASSPLQQAGTGFPFSDRPRRRECAAMGIAGLLTAAGCVAAAFLAWVGSWGHVGALLLIVATWTGANRSSGLLARRMLGRLRPASEQTPARTAAGPDPSEWSEDLLSHDWPGADTTAEAPTPGAESTTDAPAAVDDAVPVPSLVTRS